MTRFYLDRPIAHRGFHTNKIPENSMASFREAMSYGYAIELDVHLSSDDIPVVFHDESLERMTGSKGKISQYTLKSIKGLKLKNTEEKVPTLEEVLNEVDGKVPLVIEVKCLHHSGLIEEKVMELMSDYDGDYVIQSFNPWTLKWIREKHPSTILGLLTTGDYSDTKLNFVQKGLLKYMSFIPLIRPDYIGLDYRTFNLLQYFMIKKLTHGEIIFWTIDDEQLYEECLEFCDNVIFEGFHPKV